MKIEDGRWIRLAVMIAAVTAITEARAGLVAQYDFNETSGSTTYASVGSVNGTLEGGAAFDPGAFLNGNGAISLSALSGGLVTMGDNFNFAGSFSVQTWVQLAPGDSSAELAVARAYSGIVAGYILSVGNISDSCSTLPGQAHLYIEYPCGPNSTGVTVNDGAWHQLVGVYDSSADTASIYVDGALYGTSTGIAYTPLAGQPFLVGGLVIGGSPTGTFTGLEADVALWDNALSGSDVLGLYNGVESGTPEPASAAMMLGGMLALAGWARRRA